MLETCVWSLGQEDPLEKEMATHGILAWAMDRGAWWATVHEVKRGWEDPRRQFAGRIDKNWQFIG